MTKEDKPHKAAIIWDKLKVAAYTVDISEEGAALVTAKKYLPPANWVKIKLFSPYEVTTLEVRVKHVEDKNKKTLVAVKFVNVTEEQKRRSFGKCFAHQIVGWLYHKIIKQNKQD